MPRNTATLDERWPAYYRRGFVPTGFMDEIRHALLTTAPGYTLPADDKAIRDIASTVVRQLRQLGYTVERDGARWWVTNRDHRPTAEGFAAVRMAARGLTGVQRGDPAPSAVPLRAHANGSQSRRVAKVAPLPFPTPGTSAVIRRAGYDSENRASLDVGVPGVGIFTCTIERVTPEPHD